MQMLGLHIFNSLLVVSRETLMDNTIDKTKGEKAKEAIDDYFECTSFCAIDESLSDCETICMERFLKGEYF